jgi:hypothetical protein
MSIARLKNRMAFAKSPARHFPALNSNSSAASRKSFSDCGSWTCSCQRPARFLPRQDSTFAFDFGPPFRRSLRFAGIAQGCVGVELQCVAEDLCMGGDMADEF